MSLLPLAAAGWVLAAAAMSLFWAWQLRIRNPALVDAVWTAIVAGLAVFYASLGGGAPARRSAIAWMMGSWGARLVVQTLYARRPNARHGTGGQNDETPGDRHVRSIGFFQAQAASAAFFSLPALIASTNPEPNLTILELVACGLWIVGFAGETTADRQLLRFTSNPASAGETCRTGLWRHSGHANEIFEGAIWIAFALFAAGSPASWRWTAFACPATMVFLLMSGSGSHLPGPSRKAGIKSGKDCAGF
jgi:steroid 5-alpha reductase family enzyme